MTRPTPWPDASQLLLLRATVLQGAEAQAAWSQWRALGQQIRNLDEPSYRILPLLYRNLASAGVADAFTEQLRGEHRLAWYRNQALFAAARPVLRDFTRAGIEGVILKGAALAAAHPATFGGRPMNDFDVLVRRHEVDRAVTILERHGFEDTSPYGLAVARRTLGAGPFSRKDGAELDLHWHLLPLASDEGDVFNTAMPTQLLNEPVQVPSPAMQLVQTCAHGVAWAAAPMRWIADAGLLLRASGDDVDWHEVVDVSRARQLTRALHDTLEFLRDEMHVTVPAWVLGDLAATRAPASERLAHAVSAARRPLPHGGFYVVLWDRHRRRMHLEGKRPNPASYLTHLADIWGVPSRRELPRALFAKAVQLVRHGQSDALQLGPKADG